MKLKLPFGMKNGKLVQVSDVESGLKCNCFCPACGHPLVAKKGQITAHHFAHHKRAECNSAFETSLHLAAKKIIAESGYIMLPSLSNEIFYIRNIELASPTQLFYDNIYTEKRYDNFIPDIIVEKNNKPLLIEIFVSHSVDETKLRKIQSSNTSAIEIDLSKIDRQLDFNLIKEKVVDSVENKKWLHNVKGNLLHKKIINQSLKKHIVHRGLALHVDGCPIHSRVWKGKPYANFIDDCLGCNKFVVPLNSKRDDIMYCIGHKTEREINDLLVL